MSQRSHVHASAFWNILSKRRVLQTVNTVKELELFTATKTKN